MNKWNIPDTLEKEILERDKCCVYCGIEFKTSNTDKKKMATWEHIVNDIKIISKENIARCCFSCNASKGAKLLSNWLESAYCKSKNISEYTVAKVVKDALICPPKRTISFIEKSNTSSAFEKWFLGDSPERMKISISKRQAEIIWNEAVKSIIEGS